MAGTFDPTKYGGTEVSSSSSFNPEKYGGRELFKPEEPKKETILGSIKDIAKELPGAAKQVFTQPFKHPLTTLQTITSGAADAFIGTANLGLNIGDKIMGDKASGFRLPYLTKALADTQKTQQQSDVVSSIGDATKMVTGYKAGGDVFNKFKPVSMLGKLTKGGASNVLGGQIVADSESTIKERGNQALFDAAFSVVTEGLPMGAKKIFGKKEVPIVPKEKLTAEQYSQSQGYESYTNPNDLPTIPYGKGVKPEPTVKYGKNGPEVYTGEIPKEVPITPKDKVYDAQGFRPVEKDEILPNGFTTKMNTQTGEQMTNAPYKQTFEETVQTASPKFKEKVVKQAKVLEDNTSPFNDTPLDRTPGRKIKQSATFEFKIQQPNGEQSIKDIISGKVEDPNLSPQSAHRLLEEYYVETKQFDKINDLVPSVDSTVSKAGQTLSDLNQGLGSESPSLNLRKAELLKEVNLAKQGVSMDNVKAEIKTQVEQALKDLSEGKSSQDIINKLLDDFSC